MARDPDDDYLADDGDERSATQRLLAAGWLRALLVLTALAVVTVIAVPYILQWLDTDSPERTAKLDAQLSRPALTPPTRTETAPAPAPAVVTSPAPVAKEAPEMKESPAPKDADSTRQASTAKEMPPAKEMPAAKEPPRKEPARSAATTPRTEPSARSAVPSASKDTPVAKAKPVVKDTPAPKPPAKTPMVVAKATAPPPSAPAKPLDGSESYWVQVGLFENAGNAERLAQELRASRFSVEVAQVARGGATAAVSRHEVFVTGSSVDAVTAALKGSGTAQAVTGGVVVRPDLDLKVAVTLSRRLAADGLEVRIRRAVSAPASGGRTIHLVRVGGYTTPAEAQSGKKELAAKGIAGFVTQGAPK
jgi:cell division protein FtsN